MSPCHPNHPICATHTVPLIAETVSTTPSKAVCFIEENRCGLAFERGVEATLGRAIDE